MQRLIITALAAAMLAGSAGATAAQDHRDGQQWDGQRGDARNDGRDNRGDDRRGDDRRYDDRRGDDRGRGDNGNYGSWDSRWGARPNAPPRHWGRRGGWYRHVRACSMRYRSYNPRTDSYVIRVGVYSRCRL